MSALGGFPTWMKRPAKLAARILVLENAGPLVVAALAMATFAGVPSSALAQAEPATIRIRGSTTIGSGAAEPGSCNRASQTRSDSLIGRLIDGYAKSNGWTVVIEKIECVNERSRKENQDVKTVKVVTFRLNDTRGVAHRRFEVGALGSMSSIAAFQGNNADLGMMSEQMPMEWATGPAGGWQESVVRTDREKIERDVLRNNFDHVIGIDAVRVVVNPANPIGQLKRDIIQKIFCGEIRTWNEARGEPVPPDGGQKIDKVFVRDGASGTRGVFEAIMLDRGSEGRVDICGRHAGSADQLAALVGWTQKNTSQEIVEELADTKLNAWAIGYVGWASAEQDGRTLRSLNIVTGECGIVSRPVEAAVKSEDYYIARRLYLYTARELQTMPREVIDFLEYVEGVGTTYPNRRRNTAADIVTAAGFVNLTPTLIDTAEVQRQLSMPDAEYPTQHRAQYRDLAQHYRRYSVTVRFLYGSSTLDSLATANVRRLTPFNPAGQSELVRANGIWVTGHVDATVTDYSGHKFKNAFSHGHPQLSADRARSVRTALGWVASSAPPQGQTRAGLDDPAAFGAEIPRACDETERGWAINRRAELWKMP